MRVCGVRTGDYLRYFLQQSRSHRAANKNVTHSPVCHHLGACCHPACVHSDTHRTLTPHPLVAPFCTLSVRVVILNTCCHTLRVLPRRSNFLQLFHIGPTSKFRHFLAALDFTEGVKVNFLKPFIRMCSVYEEN